MSQFPPGEFSVYQFFRDESYEEVVRFTDAETATRIAKQLITSLGGRMGTTVRVIITDGGDFTNFEWQYEKGIVYPTKDQMDKLSDKSEGDV
jgi:hypothetical protein